MHVRSACARSRATPVAALVTLLLAAGTVAQDAPRPRTLAELRQAFAEQQDALHHGDAFPTAEQERELFARQEKELASFVQHEAAGEERWTARLLLADLRLLLRDRPGAVAALRGIDPTAAAPTTLLIAASQLEGLGERQRRDELVAAATAREAPLRERMEVAKLLMTLLREVDAGEAMFTQALAAASDDEGRATVRWYRAEALREREDLPENAYYEALDRLAHDLPKTFYGSVAADRVRASQFAPGAEAIPFAAKTAGGDTFELAAHRGEAVLLVFWSPLDVRGGSVAKTVQALRREHGDSLAVLGIVVDDDCAAAARAAERLGADFPQVCDGRGWQTELALRYHVETAPTMIAIDRQGRIAGLNLHAQTADGRELLRDAMARALAK